jgi:ethanolamine ammonia-lyase small subunit
VSDVRPSDPPEGEQVVANPWQFLRAYTTARIALGRAGGSLPTSRQLEFQLAHARARDAVHSELDVAALEQELRSLGIETLRLHSAAPDRATYLQRPDLGRRLDEPSRQSLIERAGTEPGGYDAAFIVADGLSALAVQRHAPAMLAAALSRLEAEQWRIAPVAIVEQGRVAIGDEIGARLGADLTVILIGERPGLSAPDSLGIYLTHTPRIGRTDAERNCISNIREAGLSYAEAAHKLAYLTSESHRLRLSGVNLKDAAGQLDLPTNVSILAENFLIDEE